MTMFSRKARKNHVLWVFGPKAGNTRSRRSLAEIFHSGDARRRRAHGRQLLARQSGVQASMWAFSELRRIRAALCAEREKRDRESRRLLRGVARVGIACAAALALAGVVTASVLPAYPSVAVAQVEPGPNWSGVGLRTSGTSPTPTEVVASGMLPAPAPATLRAEADGKAQNIMASLWAGIGGDTPDLAWLSQTGWDVTPLYAGWWEVQPWITVDHSTGNVQRFLTNQNLNYPSVVPVGTRLVAILQMPRRPGGPMNAVLIAYPPTRSHLPVIRYTSPIPTYAHETTHWHMAEAVLENPGLNGGAVVKSSNMDYSNLPLFSGALHLRLSATYPGNRGQDAVQASFVPLVISRSHAPSATTALNGITPAKGGVISATATVSVTPPTRSR